jgi:hypothetical protein
MSIAAIRCEPSSGVDIKLTVPNSTSSVRMTENGGAAGPLGGGLFCRLPLSHSAVRRLFVTPYSWL